MGRRTLKNIDEKIIKKVIKFGANNGVDKISTITIAKTLNISEPTIFVHFNTKDELLKEAFLYVGDKFLKAFKDKDIESRIGLTREEKWTKFNAFFDVANEYKEESLYFYYYRNSKYFDSLTKKEVQGNPYEDIFDNLLRFNNGMARDDEEKDFYICMVIDVVFSYLIHVHKKLFKDSEEKRKIVFDFIVDGLAKIRHGKAQ